LCYQGTYYYLLDITINASEESQDRFIALLQCLEGLTTDIDTGTVVYGYTFPDHTEALSFKRNIEKSLLNDLYLFTQNVMRYKENLVLQSFITLEIEFVDVEKEFSTL